MGWMPLPPALPCTKMVMRKVTNKGGIYEGSYYRQRPRCKAGLSNIGRDCRWPGFVSQETVAVASLGFMAGLRLCVVRWRRGIPGIGPICAMAITAFAPPMEGFRSGRDFAARLGLVPRQHSSGGKQKLGRTIEDGPTRYQKAFDYMRDVCCALEGPRRWKIGSLALKYAGPKAAHAGGDRYGKQAITDRLGNARAQSRIPRFNRSGLLRVDVLIGVPAL